MGIVLDPRAVAEQRAARVDDRGTLWLARPGRPARTVGPRRAFSPFAAPALTLSRKGLPWLAATTWDGRVLAGTPRRGRLVLRRVARAQRVPAAPAGADPIRTTSCG